MDFTLLLNSYTNLNNLPRTKIMTSNSQCDVHDLECACGTTVAVQSLEELEFERGIWGAAYEGDAARVESLLNRFNINTVHTVDAAGKFHDNYDVKRNQKYSTSMYREIYTKISY